ncbi:MAG: diguanylate cyclase, partial [Gammaproteobacteria bacterium]|nr:diguanylate cyclase [Gammaproteobacteria bacterium]
VAERLGELSGDDGIVARFGGEEFVYVGVVDAASAPAAYLEALRAAIAAIALDVDGGTLSLTASIGATLNPGVDLDDMLARADAAVYAAKAQGRNRVELR